MNPYEKIHAVLLRLQAEVKEDYTGGICEWVSWKLSSTGTEHEVWLSSRLEAFATWPSFSGNYRFPVPSHMDVQTAFDRLKKWSTKSNYGKNRRDLLNHLLNFYYEKDYVVEGYAQTLSIFRKELSNLAHVDDCVTGLHDLCARMPLYRVLFFCCTLHDATFQAVSVKMKEFYGCKNTRVFPEFTVHGPFRKNTTRAYQPTGEQGQFKNMQDYLVHLRHVQGDDVSEESIDLAVHAQIRASFASIDNFWRNSRFFALT